MARILAMTFSAMGFEAASGSLRWAYAHPRVDLVGSDDAGASILFASVDGELGALDAKSGAPVWSAATGMKRSDESKLFRFTFVHSIFLAAVLGVIVVVYAYVLPQFAP